jgi:hypothetical protein
MTADEVRELARKIVADRRRDRFGTATAPAAEPVEVLSDHSSHAVYVTIVNAGDACVIEPGVPCTHCNYCKSHGY